MRNSFYCVHDCETGGLNPDNNPITQYAAIILDPKTLDEVDRYETYIKPYCGLKIEKQALQHTQVSMSDINRGITQKQFVKEVTYFYKQYQVKSPHKGEGRLISVGHNVVFDHGFLEYALGSLDVDFWDYFYPNFIDTMVIAHLVWGKNPKDLLNLTACVERAGLEITDAHGAMNDTESTAELLRWYAKKFRLKGNVLEEDKKQRKREFFEFQCGLQ